MSLGLEGAESLTCENEGVAHSGCKLRQEASLGRGAKARIIKGPPPANAPGGRSQGAWPSRSPLQQNSEVLDELRNTTG
jgi:hypothetical protein